MRAEDVSNVKYHILQHLPVFQHDKDKFGGGWGGGVEGLGVGGLTVRAGCACGTCETCDTCCGTHVTRASRTTHTPPHMTPLSTHPHPLNTPTNETPRKRPPLPPIKPGSDAQLVNSVYFDNQNLELYHGRLDKKPGAIAVRIRWYGSGEPRKVFIERKTHRWGAAGVLWMLVG